MTDGTGRAAGASSDSGARRLAGRLIAVGVTGSIAAYKAADLVRRLRDEGADVVVLMTPSATRFVGELTFSALTRHPVETDVGGLLPDQRIGHIVIADSADAIVVAPATAHWLAAMATGLAGDPVTATCLATAAPVVVAPAMDGEMFSHPATRANVARLRDGFGYVIVEPEAGPLASGQSGQGRLAEIPAIVDAVAAAVAGRPVRAPEPADRPPLVDATGDADLEGRHIVISAGGTAEPIDPVRFIGNRSTGKMGVALAEAALARGARVTLVVGQVSVPLPPGDRMLVLRATTTAEMGEAVRAAVTGSESIADALIMAAAVADFRPRRSADRKLTRDAGLTLELEPTEDILAGIGTAVAQLPPGAPRPYLVGFAAETGSLERAADKLRRKGVDLLIANDVAEEGSGFGTDTNHVWILGADGTQVDLPLRSKRAVADEILDRVAAALDERDRAAQTEPVTQESRT
ncbi:MAG TPA: bifunctional phosphopantothenoylcysteine decarboxylase/phosphopantothenate--cysteine ligase CoaBC [Candidatus Limnocylindrales bacterium]|nr:bifunctional phosphopantothenoylcysteine decarboxylase/phosphopantothenate--cysteine ligase CoaBC [Candidatus Limnocylindrales bacterium]